MSQLTADQIFLLFGVLVPLNALIGVWAFRDVLRIRGMIERGEV